MKKSEVFDYMVTLFINWYKEITGKDDAITNAFTKLSLFKLLFLTAATKTDEGDDLLDIFDNFYALPYGPVESDIYKEMKDDNLLNYTIKDRIITLKISQPTKLSKTDQNKIKKSVDKIKNINPNLVTYNAFVLVEITQQWTSWISAYNFYNLIKESDNDKYIKITSEKIRKDRNKFYGYLGK